MPEDTILQPNNSVIGLKTTTRSAMQDAFEAAKDQQSTETETKTEEEVNTDG